MPSSAPGPAPSATATPNLRSTPGSASALSGLLSDEELAKRRDSCRTAAAERAKRALRRMPTFTSERMSSYVAAAEEDAEILVTGNDYRDAQWIPQTYKELMRTNDWRERLLDDARRFSPISSVFHLSKLKQTVIMRMLYIPMVWIVIATYAAVAALTRTGHISLAVLEDFSSGSFEGAEVLVVFMVVFYLGYCYNRHFEIYHLAAQAKSSIINICATARATLEEQPRVRLFYYLNLFHVAAYCALTPVYNKENFMDVFCQLHNIKVKEHDKLFGDVDRAGGIHYNRLGVWAQQLLHKELKEGRCHPEIFRILQEEVIKLRNLINSIFAYQYQVIPFSYSHLVSFSCFFYLLGLAILKGARFTPEATYLGGILMPCLSLLILLFSTVGLIDIGQAISDPWGNDAEDFAVPRFLHATAKISRQLIESEVEDPLDEQEDVVMGSPNISHIAVDGQTRVVRRRGSIGNPRAHRSGSGIGIGLPGFRDSKRNSGNDFMQPGMLHRMASDLTKQRRQVAGSPPRARRFSLPRSFVPDSLVRKEKTNKAAAKIQESFRRNSMERKSGEQLERQQLASSTSAKPNGGLAPDAKMLQA